MGAIKILGFNAQTGLGLSRTNNMLKFTIEMEVDLEKLIRLILILTTFI